MPKTCCLTELPSRINSHSSNHSSSSSSEITRSKSSLETPLPVNPLEEKIQEKLKLAQIKEQKAAIASLLEATRESASNLVSLCSLRLLSALPGLLLCSHAALKSTALAEVVNLSLKPDNKVRIVRSDSVPAVIDALHSSSPATMKVHAIGDFRADGGATT